MRGSADDDSFWLDVCQGRFVLLCKFPAFTSYAAVGPSVLSSAPVCSCDLFSVFSRHALVGLRCHACSSRPYSVWFEPACCLRFGRGSAGLIRIGLGRLGLLGLFGQVSFGFGRSWPILRILWFSAPSGRLDSDRVGPGNCREPAARARTINEFLKNNFVLIKSPLVLKSLHNRC